MSPTSRSSRIVEGLVHGAPASVLFLAFSLGFNARVSTSQLGFALRNPLELEQGQGSDSVVGQSQQSERGASPANAPKPVLTDGTLVVIDPLNPQVFEVDRWSPFPSIL